jgi:hypothetical protein
MLLVGYGYEEVDIGFVLPFWPNKMLGLCQNAKTFLQELRENPEISVYLESTVVLGRQIQPRIHSQAAGGPKDPVPFPLLNSAPH